MAYELLRDVLVIVISAGSVFAALVGGILFFLLRTAFVKEIEIEVGKRMDKECRMLRGESDIQAGVTYWIQGMHSHAINVTLRAITTAEDVLDESKLIFAKSNLAFYYAEKHMKEDSWELKQEAIDLAKIGYDKYSPSRSEFMRPDWIDNYTFVRSAFVQSKKEGQEIINLIDEWLARADVKSVHKYLEENKQRVLSKNLTS